MKRTRELVLEEGEHIIYLDAIDDDFPLKGGYYVKNSYSCNEVIYARGARYDAAVYTVQGAISTIRSFRRSGYPCRAEPPITVTY